MLWIYVKELIKHALNVYSVISFLLLFITPFLSVSNTTQAILGVTFGLIAIIAASYSTWKDQYEKDRNGEFIIISEHNTLSCGSVNGAGMIKDISSAVFNIDFANGTSEPKVIQKLTNFELKSGASLFGSDGVQFSFREANNPHQKVILPIKVGANDRRMLQIIIELPVIETDPNNLPVTLANLGNIELSVTFIVSNQKAEAKEHQISLIAPSSGYTKEIVKTWKIYGNPELYAAYQRKII